MNAFCPDGDFGENIERVALPGFGHPKRIVPAGIGGPHAFNQLAAIEASFVESGKPAPDPYLRAAELLDLGPGRCLAIEDSPTGSRSAQAAGCPVLVVPSTVPIPTRAGIVVTHSLAGLGVDDLAAAHGGIVAACENGAS